MPVNSPIWPAQLDHLRLNTDNMEAMVSFYGNVFGLQKLHQEDGTILLQGHERRLVIGPGAPGERPYHGFRLQDDGQLDNVRRFITAQGINTEPNPSPVFRDDSVCVRDPDGWLNIFGLPRADLPALKAANAIPGVSYHGRLQHVVVASTDLPAMMNYYENALGFVPSDYVVDDEEQQSGKRVAFYRSDPEHHSFAVFGASSSRADHHAYEASGWMDMRDWADHLSNHNIPIWWGPGRHGPGNNLFFMFKDPHGDPLEISAELERMPREMAPRWWPHNERSVNLWGGGWIRE